MGSGASFDAGWGSSDNGRYFCHSKLNSANLIQEKLLSYTYCSSFQVVIEFSDWEELIGMLGNGAIFQL